MKNRSSFMPHMLNPTFRAMNRDHYIEKIADDFLSTLPRIDTGYKYGHRTNRSYTREEALLYARELTDPTGDTPALFASAKLGSIHDNVRKSMIIADPKILKRSNNTEHIVETAELFGEEMKSKGVHVQRDFMEAMTKFTMKNGLPKHQSGQQLINNAIGFTSLQYEYVDSKRASMSIGDLGKGIGAFNKSATAIAFDMETLGGQDKYGRQTLDMITDFAATVFDTQTAQPLKAYETAIGYDEKMSAYLESVVADLEKTGNFSGKSKVIADRLWAQGHKDTALKYHADGNVTYAGFGNVADVNRMGFAQMRKGIETGRKIHAYQSKYVKDGLLPSERVILEAMEAMRRAPILGANIHNFDIPALNQAIVTQFGEEFQKQSGGSFRPENIVDTTQLLRHMPDAKKRALIAATPGMNDAMVKNNWTMGMQETWAYYAGIHGKTHHSAYADTVTSASTAVHQVGTSGKNFINYAFDTIDKNNRVVRELKLGGHEMFIPKTSDGPSYSGKGLLSFVHDSQSGTLRTYGGYELGQQGISKQRFGQYGVKKDMPYTIQVGALLEADLKLSKAMASASPEMAVKDLAFLKMSALYDPSSTEHGGLVQRYQSDTYKVGTFKDITDYVQNELLLVGEKDSSGKMQWLGGKEGHVVAEKLASKRIETMADGTKTVVQEKMPSIEEFIAQKSRGAVQDNASSIVRQHDNVNLYKNYMAAMDYVEGLVGQGKDRKTVLRNLMEETHKVAKQVAAGQAPSQSGSIKSLFDYMSHSNSNGIALFRETSDKFFGGYEGFRKNRHVFAEVVREAGAMAKQHNLGKDGEMYYFQALMEGLQQESAVEATTGRVSRPIEAWRSNVYDVDLKGLLGSKEKELYTFDLENIDYQLEKKIGGLVAPGQKAPSFQQIVQHISKTEGVGLLDNTTPEIQLSHLRDGLAGKRSADPSAGYLKEFYAHDLKRGSTMADIYKDTASVAVALERVKGRTPVLNPIGDKNYKAVAQQAASLFFPTIDASGYTHFGQDAATRMQKLSHIQQNDATRYLENLIGSIHKAGMKLYHTSDFSNVYAMEGEQYLDLKPYMPRMVDQDGVRVMQIGGSKVLNPMTVVGGKDGLRSSSFLGATLDNHWKLQGVLEKSAARGEGIETLKGYGKSMGKRLRESPDAGAANMKTAKEMGLAKLSYVYGAVHEMARGGAFDNMAVHEGMDKNKLIEALKGKQYKDGTYKPLSKMGAEEQYLVGAHMDRIVNIGRDKSDEFLAQVAPLLNMSSSGSKLEDMHYAYDMAYSPGERMSVSKRDYFRQTAAMPFIEKDVQENINRLRLTGIDIGKTIDTRSGAAYSVRNMAGTYTEKANAYITANVFSTNDTALAAMIAGSKTMDEHMKKAALKFSVSESGSIGDSRVMDAAFAALDTSMQKRKIKDIFDLATLSESVVAGKTFNISDELTQRRSMMPKIIAGQDGSITFAYSKGVNINAGDSMVIVDQMGAPVKEQAVADGLARFGVFRSSDGRLVTEGIINDMIAKGEVRGNNAQAVFESLLSLEKDGGKIFQGAVYLDELAMSTTNKNIIDMTEKTVTSYAYTPLGHLDKELGKQVAKIDKRFLGIVPKESHIENILLASAPESQREWLRERIYKERHGLSEGFQEMFREYGIIGSGEQIHAVTAHLQEGYKHGELTMQANQLASELKHKLQQTGGYSPARMEELLGDVYGGVTFDQDKNMFIVGDERYNVSKHEALVKQFGLGRFYTTGTVDADGNAIDYGAVVRSNIGRVYDPTRGKEYNALTLARGGAKDTMGGLTFDDRGKMTLLYNQYHKSTLDRLRPMMGEDAYKNIFGHVIDSDGKYSGKEGAPMAAAAVGYFDKQRFVRPGEKMVKAGAGLDVYQNEAMARLRAMSVESVTQTALSDYMSVEDSLRANHINIEATMGMGSKMIDGRYTKVGIVDVGTNRSTAHLENVSTHHGKNLLLEFNTPYLNKSNLQFDHIAVPGYTPSMINDTEHVANKVHTEVSQMKRLVENFHKRAESGTDDFGPAERSTLINDITNQRTVINAAIRETAFSSKDGIVKNFVKHQIEESARYKVGFVNPTKASAEMLLGDKMFGGQQLLDFYNMSNKGAKALPVDFTLMPQKFFESNLLQKETYKDLLGLDSREDMMRLLETQGVQGMTYRYPADYMTSMSPSQLYLDRSLPSDQIKRSLPAGLGQHADQDGDSTSVALMRSRATIQKTRKDGSRTSINREISLLEYNFLQDPENARRASITGIKLHEKEFFDGLQASMVMNADHNRKNFVAQLTENRDLSRAMDILGVDSLKDNPLINMQASGEWLATAESLDTRRAMASGLSKASRAFAGHINVPINEIRMLAQSESLDMAGRPLFDSNEQKTALLQTTTALMEQYLSPKHEKGSDQVIDGIKKIGRLQDALGDAFERQDSSKLRNLFEQMELVNRKELQGQAFGDSQEVINQAVSFFERIAIDKEHYRALKLGNVANVNEKIVASAGLADISTYNWMVKSALQDDAMKVAASLTVNERRVNMLGRGAYDKTLLSDGREWLLEEESQRISKRAVLMERTGEMFRRASENLTGKDLAIGAVGIAGAMMAASFIGGNPSEPAQMQAHNAHQEGFYNIPSLSDSAVDMNNESHQGYVINVNAETRRGRKQAINAINEAMSQAYSTNVNISMNIRDSSGNINSDRQIEQMIERAFR